MAAGSRMRSPVNPNITMFGAMAGTAAIFFYSRDRAAEHPNRHLAGYSGIGGILQADAYAGFNDLRSPRPRAGRMDGASCSISHS
jgi:transposase